MKRIVPKYAALLAASVCSGLLVPRADSATLSGSVQSSVYEWVDYLLGPGVSCSDSTTDPGPSVSAYLDCYSSYGATAEAWLNGTGNDVYGEFDYGAANSDDVYSYPHHDMYAEVYIHFMASGFFYITAPSSTVDLAFQTVECPSDCSMTVNGVPAPDPTAVLNVPSYTQVPYSLEFSDLLWNQLAPESTWAASWASFDLRAVTVKDHVSGATLDNAQISFSATAVPETGSAVLCCLGLALIALSHRKSRRECPR